ncbi:Uncharacterised protein g3357 [Pycnogonum litorale]
MSFYIFIVLTGIFSLSLQDTCTVRLLTSPYSDCENTYWKNVTFVFFGRSEVEFVSPVMDVCDAGNTPVFLNDVEAISEGNVGLIQNDVGGQLPLPDLREWHLEAIVVNCETFTSEVIFGIGRKVESGRRYRYLHYDTSLPRSFIIDEQRLHEMAVKRVEYTQTRILGVGPFSLKQLPREDAFENQLQRNGTAPARNIGRIGFGIKFSNPNVSLEFTSIQEIQTFWDDLTPPFPTRPLVDFWDEDDFFAAQRLQGSSPDIIRYIRNVPRSFRLDFSRAKRITGRRIRNTNLLIADLALLDEIPSYWSPMALFYLNDQGNLKPLAIQLTRNASREQVFYPDDETNAWNLAKIYYNGAEAVYHQVYKHFQSVHLLLDNVGVLVYRYLSPSHPIFKIMKPHFYLMFGNNMQAQPLIFAPNGILDQVTTGGSVAGVQLLNKGIDTLDYFHLNPVLDNIYRRTNDIPVYPYRDRGIDIYRAIKLYVKDVLTNYYGSSLRNPILDAEVRTWRIMLARSSERLGAGIANLPGSDRFGVMSLKQLINIVATFIYQASVKHAAVGNEQFLQFAFPPNYPLTLRRPPPETKVGITEEDIIASLPNKLTTYRIGAIMLSLSYDLGNQFGQFKRQLLHSPEDQMAIEKFRKRLDGLSRKEYPSLNYPYTALDIDRINNSPDV